MWCRRRPTNVVPKCTWKGDNSPRGGGSFSRSLLLVSPPADRGLFVTELPPRVSTPLRLFLLLLWNLPSQSQADEMIKKTVCYRNKWQDYFSPPFFPAHAENSRGEVTSFCRHRSGFSGFVSHVCGLNSFMLKGTKSAGGSLSVTWLRRQNNSSLQPSEGFFLSVFGLI